MTATERELEFELDESTDVTADLPATLDEQQRALVEMQQVFEYTHEPGVMKLPVTSVATADNSDQWSITLEHPIIGDITLFVKKPITGWHADCELAELLSWYNIHDQNVYKLQREFLYVEHDEEKAEQAHGWRLVSPPWTADEPSTTRRLRAWLAAARPDRTVITMWLTLLVGTVALMATITRSGAIAAVTFASFVMSTLLAIMILDAQGEV